MTTATRKLTALEFLDLPIQDNPAKREELVRGEVVVSPRPHSRHANVLTELTILLGQHIKQNDLGLLLAEIDIVFGDDEVRSPDLVFYVKARASLAKQDVVSAMPDLCIEVLSPSTAAMDRIDKFNLYQDQGIAFYWIIDPQGKTFEVWKLENGKYVNAGRASNNQTAAFPPFPQLPIPLATLWFTV